MQLSSTDFRGLINRRFAKNLLPIPATPVLGLNRLAPDFTLPRVGAEDSLQLSCYRGQRPVVVAFTRIFTEKQYCPLCLPHLVSLNRAYDQFIGAGAELLLITSTDRRQSQAVQRDLGLSMPLLSDSACTVFRQYGTGQALGAPLPAQFVLDTDGRLRFQHLFSFLHHNATPERLLWAVRNL
ncbi:redoxin domain-containing protein [Romeria aff. gracilis LEGE 07310]|uniref:Redoxin domain-containing protein n=1 Tax=Vasconcelosia minhoensis LEGE 07310 TaxID=915328 RepID=A0A8J7DQK6_9CYAN|nr:redoxin domain-containing protein [Romeria aff. gracilis LEGE 07310]